MATQSEAEIDRLLAPTAAEYVDEEHAAASAVFSVRLPPATHEAIRAAATRGAPDSLGAEPPGG